MFDKKKTYAKPIREGKLVLMSAVDPFAYFNVTNALDRNIYVCGLSELQFITASHINSGGVWFTTIQNFHYHWTKQLVLDDDRYNGNIRLLEKTKMDRGNIGLYDTLLASGSFWKASTFSMAKGSAMYIWLSME